jgi:hypothetical protein
MQAAADESGEYRHSWSLELRVEKSTRRLARSQRRSRRIRGNHLVFSFINDFITSDVP